MELKVEDLKIGNYIFDNSGRIVQYHGLTEDWNKAILNYAKGSGIYKNNFDEISPIPITEKWLLKLGFEPDEIYKNFNSFNLYKLECEGNIFKLEIQPCNEVSIHIDCTFIRSLKYIHELQNLYHAITGNELKIKD